MLVNIRIRGIKDGFDINHVTQEVARIYSMSDPSFFQLLQESINRPGSAKPILEAVDSDEADFNCAVLEQAGLACYIEPIDNLATASTPLITAEAPKDETSATADSVTAEAHQDEDSLLMDLNNFGMPPEEPSDAQDIKTTNTDNIEDSEEFEFDLSFASELTNDDSEPSSTESEPAAVELDPPDLNDKFDLSGLSLENLEAEDEDEAEADDLEAAPALLEDNNKVTIEDSPFDLTLPKTSAEEAPSKANTENASDPQEKVEGLEKPAPSTTETIVTDSSTTDFGDTDEQDFDLPLVSSRQIGQTDNDATEKPAAIEISANTTPDKQTQPPAEQPIADTPPKPASVDQNKNSDVNQKDFEQLLNIDALGGTLSNIEEQDETLVDLDAQTLIINEPKAPAVTANEATDDSTAQKKPTQVSETSTFENSTTTLNIKRTAFSTKTYGLAASLVLTISVAASFTLYKDEITSLMLPQVDLANLDVRTPLPQKRPAAKNNDNNFEQALDSDSHLSNDINLLMTEDPELLDSKMLRDAISKISAIESAVTQRTTLHHLMTLVDLSDNSATLAIGLANKPPIFNADLRTLFTSQLINILSNSDLIDVAHSYINGLKSNFEALEAINQVLHDLPQSSKHEREALLDQMKVRSELLDLPYQRAIAYNNIATVIIQSGNQELATHWLEDAFKQTNKTLRDDRKIEALARIALDQPRYGEEDRSEALYAAMQKVADDMSKYNPQKPICYKILAITLAKAKKTEASKYYLNKINDPVLHQLTLIELAKMTEQSGNLAVINDFESILIGNDEVSLLEE